MSQSEAVFRFNANVSYGGLLHAVTEDVSIHCSSEIFSTFLVPVILIHLYLVLIYMVL